MTTEDAHCIRCQWPTGTLDAAVTGHAILQAQTLTLAQPLSGRNPRMHALQVTQLQEEVVSHLLAKDDTDLDSRNVILEVTSLCLYPSLLLHWTQHNEPRRNDHCLMQDPTDPR